MSVTPQEYCKDPTKYANDPTLTAEIKQYWNGYCQILKDENNNMGQLNMKDLAEGNPSSLEAFFMSLVSPQGLEMMSIILGGTILLKTMRKVILGWIKNGISDSVRQAIEEMVAKGGSEAAGNASIMLHEIWSRLTIGDIDGTSEAISYAATAMMEAAEALGTIIEVVGIVTMALQLIGSIIGLWETCDVDNEMDAQALQTFSDKFNDVFRSQVMVQIESYKDSYGHVTLGTVWPIEYYADRSFLQSEKEDYYAPIRARLMMEYLNTLQMNSIGQPINWDYNGGQLIQNSTLSAMEKTMVNFFSDDNAVVGNWIAKYWPILLLIVVLIIILIILIKSKNE